MIAFNKCFSKPGKTGNESILLLSYPDRIGLISLDIFICSGEI